MKPTCRLAKFLALASLCGAIISGCATFPAAQLPDAERPREVSGAARKGALGGNLNGPRDRAHSDGELDATVAGAGDQESPEPKIEARGADDAWTTRFSWQEGLVAKTDDDAFRFHVGGRLDWDSGWYRVPANIQQSLNGTPLLDGTDLRRFRLGIDGTSWEQVDFALEADFSRASDFTGFQTNPQTNIFITNAWIAARDLPFVDTVRAGHQKEYLTFANATSAKFLPFMERPYIFDAFENPFSYDLGISTNRAYFDQAVTTWLGAFWNGTRSQAFNVAGHYAASGRVTWMPIYGEQQQQWLCFNLSGSVRSFGTNDPDDINVRPLVRTGQSFDVPNLLHTGTLLSRDGLEIFGAGVHGVRGPLTLGAEFLSWNVSNVYTGSLPNADGTLPPGAHSLGNLLLFGFYVEALCFLTPGDTHAVDRAMPGFDRVRPVRNLSRKKGETGLNGLGAWELGVRYDHVDLNSGLLNAGRLESITAGLNWYLNPNSRVTLNYVHTLRDTDSATANGRFDAIGVRFHFDF